MKKLNIERKKKAEKHEEKSNKNADISS